MGCTDEGACNYDDCANLDDGSCVLPDDLTGCGDTCLDGGVLYEFSITDSFGDGMCCAYGEGGYSIVVDGVTIASGGDFADAAEERSALQQMPVCSSSSLRTTTQLNRSGA